MEPIWSFSRDLNDVLILQTKIIQHFSLNFNSNLQTLKYPYIFLPSKNYHSFLPHKERSLHSPQALIPIPIQSVLAILMFPSLLFRNNLLKRHVCDSYFLFAEEIKCLSCKIRVRTYDTECQVNDDVRNSSMLKCLFLVRKVSTPTAAIRTFVCVFFPVSVYGSARQEEIHLSSFRESLRICHLTQACGRNEEHRQRIVLKNKTKILLCSEIDSQYFATCNQN